LARRRAVTVPALLLLDRLFDGAARYVVMGDWNRLGTQDGELESRSRGHQDRSTISLFVQRFIGRSTASGRDYHAPPATHGGRRLYNHPMTANRSLEAWVGESERLCRPDKVVWCDGSEAERARLTAEAVRIGDFIPLDERKLPGCHLHRSALNDVARTEKLTFICATGKDDAGPTNYWMAPAEAYDRVGAASSSGSMKGRTMYVVPFLMGPTGSRSARSASS